MATRPPFAAWAGMASHMLMTYGWGESRPRHRASHGRVTAKFCIVIVTAHSKSGPARASLPQDPPPSHGRVTAPDHRPPPRGACSASTASPTVDRGAHTAPSAHRRTGQQSTEGHTSAQPDSRQRGTHSARRRRGRVVRIDALSAPVDGGDAIEGASRLLAPPQLSDAARLAGRQAASAPAAPRGGGGGGGGHRRPRSAGR